MTTLIALCAWCLRAQPPTLTVLDGTPPELALLALETPDGVTHGICSDHSQRIRDQIGHR